MNLFQYLFRRKERQGGYSEQIIAISGNVSWQKMAWNEKKWQINSLKKCENRIKIDAAVNQDYCIGSNLNCIDEQVKSNKTIQQRVCEW